MIDNNTTLFINFFFFSVGIDLPRGSSGAGGGGGGKGAVGKTVLITIIDNSGHNVPTGIEGQVIAGKTKYGYLAGLGKISQMSIDVNKPAKDQVSLSQIFLSQLKLTQPFICIYLYTVTRQCIGPRYHDQTKGA